MRGKRAKQYRKLMHQYALAFDFREPYQVLVDAEMIQDTTRFRMDLPHLLERTLHGQVKPMITQCSIRHLYTATHEDRSEKSSWIETAKTFERRRCGHHELEQPLSAEECMMSVVDPKGSGTNKHRYIVASQDAGIRAKMRQVTGVPLVYVSRSVMVMEPMAQKTEEVKSGQERDKIRAGIIRGKAGPLQGVKRKREEDAPSVGGPAPAAAEQPQLKKKKKALKGVNPLSAMKPKRRKDGSPEAKAGPRPDRNAALPERIARQLRAAKEGRTKKGGDDTQDPSASKKRSKTADDQPPTNISLTVDEQAPAA